MIWPSALVGFASSFSLAIAIGAQNAFILRQGLKREHILKIVLFCTTADLLLMACGVYGLASIAGLAPFLLPVMKWGGCLFLFGYGIRSFIRAARAEHLSLSGEQSGLMRLEVLFLQLFAFTFLNPHVYLDTVLLLGSIAQTQPENGRLSFLIGTGGGSLLWFLLLGYSARVLAPLFKKPVSWKILDVLIGVTMCLLAVGLAINN